jgi:hypothetical protein
VSLAEIERGARSNRNFLFQENQFFLEILNNAGRQKIEFLYPPYPQSDVSNPGVWCWTYFSPQRTVDRLQAIYSAALFGYREVVETYFEKLAKRLPLYSIFPIRLSGTVFPINKAAVSEHLLFWATEPHASCSSAEFKLGLREEGLAFYKQCYSRYTDLLQNRKLPAWCCIYGGESPATTFGPDDAAKLVSNWLKNDLKAVGFNV